MENILHDFNEKVISLIANCLKNSITEKGISDFTNDLESEMIAFGRDVVQFLVEYAEDVIFKLKERKEKFESLEKDDRTIISIFGETNFKRRYYQDKDTKERIYLLDQFLKLEKRERMLPNVKERLIEEARETSYRKAGQKASYGTEISKQTVKNEINKLDFKSEIAEEKEKTARKRKEDLMNYILNNVEGIKNLYRNKKELHGCSAEGHISHIYSDRMSSRPMGWSTRNVNNMSKLRTSREDNISTKEILEKSKKVIEFKEIQKIRNQANAKIKESINFKPVSVPIMNFGAQEEKIFFKNLLEYKAV